MKITYGADLPVEPDEAFALVSDPDNWPAIFESMESVEILEGWGAPGGRARMVNRVLGRRIVTDIELVEWSPPTRFRYTGHNSGRADTDNLRVFEKLPGGTRFTGTSSAQPRRGIAGLVDRIILYSAHGIYRRAMKKLPAVAARGAGRAR